MENFNILIIYVDDGDEVMIVMVTSSFPVLPSFAGPYHHAPSSPESQVITYNNYRGSLTCQCVVLV